MEHTGVGGEIGNVILPFKTAHRGNSLSLLKKKGEGALESSSPLYMKLLPHCLKHEQTFQLI